MKTLYFAYGSNLWLEQMLKRCPDAKVFSKGILKGYRWIISARGYANVVKSVNDPVYGIIYEISELDERKLDRCEGVAGGSYRKEYMPISVDEKMIRQMGGGRDHDPRISGTVLVALKILMGGYYRRSPRHGIPDDAKPKQKSRILPGTLRCPHRHTGHRRGVL